VRKKKESNRGTTDPASSGAKSPALAKSAAARVPRSRDDFPAMFGAVSSQSPSQSNEFGACTKGVYTIMQIGRIRHFLLLSGHVCYFPAMFGAVSSHSPSQSNEFGACTRKGV